MYKKIITFIIAFTVLFSPLMVSYAAGIVPDCGKVVSTTDSQGHNSYSIAHPCNFEYFMQLINNVITFLLFYLATPIAAIALCYAGALLLFSGGSSEKITKAKKIIKNIVIGYVLALAAWLIVKTIFSALGFKGETFLK